MANTEFRSHRWQNAKCEEESGLSLLNTLFRYVSLFFEKSLKVVLAIYSKLGVYHGFKIFYDNVLGTCRFSNGPNISHIL